MCSKLSSTSTTNWSCSTVRFLLFPQQGSNLEGCECRDTKGQGKISLEIPALGEDVRVSSLSPDPTAGCNT
jgi:hypothetical protein